MQDFFLKYYTSGCCNGCFLKHQDYLSLVTHLRLKTKNIASQVKLLKSDIAMTRCFFKSHDSSLNRESPIEVTKSSVRHHNSLLLHNEEVLSELHLINC